MKYYGYTIIKSNETVIKGEYFNAAVYRFFEFEKYLMDHQNEFDRVALTDVKDVYWFADGFQTFDSNEFLMFNECDDFDNNNPFWCRQFGYRPRSNWNEKGVNECFGKEILDEI